MIVARVSRNLNCFFNKIQQKISMSRNYQNTLSNLASWQTGRSVNISLTNARIYNCRTSAKIFTTVLALLFAFAKVSRPKLRYITKIFFNEMKKQCIGRYDGARIWNFRHWRLKKWSSSNKYQAFTKEGINQLTLSKPARNESGVR